MTVNTAETLFSPPGSTWISFFVPGEPRPQGSKTARVIHGRAVMTELADMKTKSRKSGSLKRWRENVKMTYLSYPVRPYGQYWSISATFWFRRPKSHYTKTGMLTKRAQAILYPGKPDTSHLMRAIEDALTTAGAWSDDSRVAHYGEVWKQWCDIRNPEEGAGITLNKLG